MSRQQQSPFDPFSPFDDDGGNAAADDQRGGATTPASNYSAARTRSLERVPEEGTAKPLPPRMTVRLNLHEEITSTAVADPGGGESGSLSQLSIEGKITARVESSNANENAPFCLKIAGPMASMANFTCNKYCIIEDDEAATKATPFTKDDIGNVKCKVDVPKSEVAGCEILTYSLSARTQNMPILVQTKAAIHEKKCRISVQVRSNLSNRGDLSDFLIVAAIPPTLRGDSLEITRGDTGAWDANKRTVTWRVGNLPHGESCLVSAEADVARAMVDAMMENPFSARSAEERVRCPVMVRCLSGVDQVSDLTLSSLALDGATIVQKQTCSYRSCAAISRQ